MRRVGLALVTGLGLAAGGIGVGWFAAVLEGSGRNTKDIADIGPAVEPAAGHEAPAPVPVADTAPLRAAANRAEALGTEVARLRWRISDLRRQCRWEPPAAQPLLSERPPDEAARPELAGPVERPPVDIAAVEPSGPPESMIGNPPRAEVTPAAVPRAARQAVAPPVPPPPLTPERERAPVRVAVAEPSPAVRPAPVAVDPPAANPPYGVGGRPVQRSVPAAPAQAAALTPAEPPARAMAEPTPPPPEPLYRPGQALFVPEEAVRSGDLSFLDGCWLSEAFDNPVNGNASTKIYCFDANGNGQMSFRGVDGITCRVDVQARWEPGRRLVLDEPQDGTCGTIGPWHREVTNCAIGGDGLARCDSYEFYRQFNYDTRMTRI